MSAVLERETKTHTQVLEPERISSIDGMITYPVTKSDIIQLRAKFAGLNCATPKDYETTRVAIGTLRDLRVKVEKRRKELKADSLEFGRKVDSVARFLTSEIESIENPLALLKQEVDDAKAREKLRKKQEERERVEAEVKAKREKEEAELRAKREEEEARLAAERARLEAERAEMAAKQKAIDEANRIEREKVEAERRKAESEAKERQAKIDAENAAKQAAIDEANRIEREKMEVERKKAEAEAKERQAKIDAENAAKQAAIDAENRRLEQERRAIEAAKQKAEREEFERQAKLKAEKEAKERIERERQEAEAAAKAKAEAEEQERQRLESIKPDIQKVRDFADQLSLIYAPKVSSKEAKSWIVRAMQQIKAVAEELKSFDGKSDGIPY